MASSCSRNIEATREINPYRATMYKLVTVFAIIAAVASQTPPAPTPDTSFRCESVGLHPHPEVCSQFYSCDEAGNAWLQQCPANLVFNPATEACDFPSNVNCDASSERASVYNQECLYEAPEEFNCIGVENNAYPHPQYCEKYYDCYNNVTTLCQCLDGWLFDLTYSGCNYPDVTDCGNRTSPDPVTAGPTQSPPVNPTAPGGFKCPSLTGLYPNPDDCSSFFNCVSGNPFLENCPPTLVFNPDLLICDYKANVPSCQD